MYKGIYDKFASWYENKSIYLYSDPHFGDKETNELRENYIGDDEQVKRINAKVGPRDTLIILGDIGDVEYVKKLRGYKVLVQGNHDRGASYYQKRTKFAGEFSTFADAKRAERYGEIDYYQYQFVSPFIYGMKSNRLFDEVYEGVLAISPKIILSHEPIDWPYALNLHGHDHSNTEFKDGRHINLCAECIDYTPMCLTTIIKSGILKDIPDIHRATIDAAIKRRCADDSQA